MTLYLKYRPQTIEELDLESVREGLKKIIKAPQMPHAFLFAGPKGTGKTSAARVLAKIVNCDKLQNSHEPCNECDQCLAIIKGTHLDVIEMDAASNRGIDDIRSLKEHIALAPANGKKKLYIIDEAHMLTTEASNALLKTLEEPPDHALFILATTDPQKLPDTIQSRLTTVQFTKATPKEIERQLTRVISGEKLTVEDGVSDLIAQAADGSFRDAVKILESLSMGNSKITNELAEEFVFQKKSANPTNFLKILASKNIETIFQSITELTRQGTQMKQFTDRLIEAARAEMVKSITEKSASSLSSDELAHLLELLLNARALLAKSPVAELPLELAFIEWVGADTKQTREETKEEPPKVSLPAVTPTKTVVHEKPQAVKEYGSQGQLDKTMWMQILAEVRGKNTTVDALLRAAHPLEFDGQKLSIAVYYRFHKERLEVNQNLKAVEDVCAQVFGSPVRVTYSLEERQVPTATTPDLPLTQTREQDILSAAKEIFGS